MICPKCQNPMQTVDRLGVHIDQCTGCRGIFLDRGELEHISAAEQRHYAVAAPPPYQPEPMAGPMTGVHGGRPDSPPPFRAEQHRGHYPDSPRPHGSYGSHRGHYPDSPRPHGGHYPDSPRPHGSHRGKKRRGFLEDLFD